MDLNELLRQANNALGRGQIVIEVTHYEDTSFGRDFRIGPPSSYILRRSTPEEQERRVRLVIERERVL